MTHDYAKTVLLRPSENTKTGGEECAKLVVIQGQTPGVQILLDRPQTTIGRLPDNDLVLDSSTVSRSHGRITRDGDIYDIEDLDSQNGIAINGSRLKPNERRPLCHGDTLRFGDQCVVFINPCGFSDQAGLSVISFDREKVSAEVDALLARLPLLIKRSPP